VPIASLGHLSLASRFPNLASELAQDAQVAGYVFEEHASGDREHGQKDEAIPAGLIGVVREKTRDDHREDRRASNEERQPNDRIDCGVQAIKSPNPLEHPKPFGLTRRGSFVRRQFQIAGIRDTPRGRAEDSQSLVNLGALLGFRQETRRLTSSLRLSICFQLKPGTAIRATTSPLGR